MNYISTRGNAAAVGFEDALLRGLAEDGGLYMPAHWPQISPQQIAAFRDAPYADIAFACLRPFLDAHWPDTELRAVIARACAAFDHPAVSPLRPLGEGEHLLELFHGPTLSFKDVAMQLLAGLFAAALRRRGGKATIIAATSGDTGSAAIHGFRGMEEADVFILYPHGRISDAQRRQMTTPAEDNVHAVAVEGSFDDCQSLVKQCFADESLRRDLSLTAVNSINWARIMAQAVYYFAAAAQLDSRLPPPRFTVPTGNFGNIFAGYGAMRMGLPASGLVIATNANDLLYRCFHEGEYRPREVIPTCAPSMDIQIASNFERLVFELAERDSNTPRRFIEEVKTHGRFAIPAPMLERLRARFRAERVLETEIPAVMEDVWRQSGVEIDPHTAIGVGASRRARGGGEASDIILATAHPAKFPESRVAPPQGTAAEARIDGLREQPERLYRLPAEMSQVRAFLREHSRLSRNRS